MIKIKPITTYTSERLLDLCISGIDVSRSKALSDRLKNARSQIIQDLNNFESLVATNSLNSLSKDFKTKYLDNAILEENDLEKLYNQYLVGSNKPAREVYDKIRASNGICPYCGIGEVCEVDHFFPKSKYQQYSVCINNLLPVCHPCNHIKSDKEPISNGGSIIYPFFDDDCYFNDQWIIANFDPIDELFDFMFCPPISWNDLQKKNANFHFEFFEIARRYGVYSTSKLDTYKSSSSFSSLQELTEIKDLDNYLPNDYERLMFEALKRYFEKMPVTNSIECPRCKGKNKILDITCDICSGVGHIGSCRLDRLSEDEILKDFECGHPDMNKKDCHLCQGIERVSYNKALDY